MNNLMVLPKMRIFSLWIPDALQFDHWFYEIRISPANRRRLYNKIDREFVQFSVSSWVDIRYLNWEHYLIGYEIHLTKIAKQNFHFVIALHNLVLKNHCKQSSGN